MLKKYYRRIFKQIDFYVFFSFIRQNPDEELLQPHKSILLDIGWPKFKYFKIYLKKQEFHPKMDKFRHT